MKSLISWVGWKIRQVSSYLSAAKDLKERWFRGFLVYERIPGSCLDEKNRGVVVCLRGPVRRLKDSVFSGFWIFEYLQLFFRLTFQLNLNSTSPAKKTIINYIKSSSKQDFFLQVFSSSFFSSSGAMHYYSILYWPSEPSETETSESWMILDSLDRDDSPRNRLLTTEDVISLHDQMLGGQGTGSLKMADFPVPSGYVKIAIENDHL